MQFWRSQFDKLLLASILALLLSMLLHLLHLKTPSDLAAPAIAWLEKSIDMITGSLLTLVTGHLLRSPPEE